VHQSKDPATTIEELPATRIVTPAAHRIGVDNPGKNGNKVKAETKSTKRSAGIEVRDSSVHGRGVFATKAIAKGKRIIEYVGERMSWEKASAESDDPHTFLFGLEDDDKVINAGIGGNESRWINHSCAPNCEAIEENGRVFIYALRNIRPGEELSYDYALELDEPVTPDLKKEHACYCRASSCRGSLLAVK
jgi:SET domain-containing protein